MKRIVPFAIATAGLVHLWIAPQHYAHAPVHGIFFVVAGLAQLAWAYLFLKKTDKNLYYSGLVLTGGLIVLWAITRVVVAPFHDDPGEIDAAGILCKSLELVGMFGLAWLVSRGTVTGVSKQSLARALGAALLISIASGGFLYGIAVGAEKVLPLLSSGEEHHQHDE